MPGRKSSSHCVASHQKETHFKLARLGAESQRENEGKPVLLIGFFGWQGTVIAWARQVYLNSLGPWGRFSKRHPA